MAYRPRKTQAKNNHQERNHSQTCGGKSRQYTMFRVAGDGQELIQAEQCPNPSQDEINTNEFVSKFLEQPVALQSTRYDKLSVSYWHFISTSSIKTYAPVPSSTTQSLIKISSILEPLSCCCSNG